jgi:ATP-dependent helicase/DNAse subunit B
MPFGFEGVAPAELAGTSGTLFVGGLIDRVDRIGHTLVIMDYKSGVNLPDEKQIEQARHFQMMVYLRAAQQIIGRETPDLNVQAGLFWSLRRPEKTVLVTASDPRLANLETILHKNIEDGRAGDFRVQPNGMEDGKCFKYCEYYQLCRVVRTDLYKTR